MKKKKKRSAGGNYGKPSLKNGVTPEYLTFPLTTYESVDKNGVKSLEIPLQSVLRLREFDIENKK